VGRCQSDRREGDVGGALLVQLGGGLKQTLAIAERQAELAKVGVG
jgi:hypothetical protein